MNLDPYREKRDFARTSEPHGIDAAPGDRLRFVIQKHDASRLHYDLRLELDGVLKSWAIPKGPSLDPGEKRLAVMVEDHPLDYQNFEGNIPEGEYGAGSVMIWDRGYYCVPDTCERHDAEAAVRKGIDKGHVAIVLHGEKLNGRFALARMRSRGDENWLLLKADDEYANQPIADDDISAATGRTMKQIAKDRPTAALDEELSDAPEAPMPHDVSPMLATLVKEAFDSPDWLFEIKWDGYRAMAEVQQSGVRLYSRNLNSFNDSFPSIVEALSGLGTEAVLDGEVVVVDEDGVSQFQLLQNYFRTRAGRLVYYVFDILYLDGHDLTRLPLRRRKGILRRVLSDNGWIRLSDHVERFGKRFFNLAAERRLEGIMGKRAESVYQPGTRSRDWVKIRVTHRQEFVIGGFTEPRGGRKDLGALVLGYFRDEKLIYAGHAGTGLDEKGLAETKSKLAPLERKTSPFAEPPRPNAAVHWVEPVLICEIAFSGWTEDGLLRHPVIVGLREDKSAQEVVREMPSETPKGKYAVKPSAKEERDVEIGGHILRLTNMNKVFWPDEGYTKADLIAYYRDVASFILPHLKNRPESLNRHPDGISGESFFQKNVGTELVPDWMQTIRLPNDEGGETNYVLCENEASLVFLANLGCIELNPWLSRVESLDKSDFAVMDLDPLDVPFVTVVEAAREVRAVLDQAGVPGYPKTSGATGLHIYIPLGAKHTFDQARDFTALIAHLVNRRVPGITSVERDPAKRRNRVYLDYLQNRRAQTVAAVYCVRPFPKAPVSTPLAWDEVRPGLHPTQFTIRTVVRRLESMGDIFQPVLREGIDLASALNALGT